MEATKESVELSKKLSDLMKSIEEMSVLELSDFVKALENRFGVSASMPVMAGVAAGAPGGAPSQEAEVKTDFEVVLTKVGANKIQVIKELRTLTSLGLKEAKDLVDSAPKTIKTDVPKVEADNIKAKLEAVGATVELK
ncbi:MAG: 50S ribosomal protein L7/L12 [Candidatus Omnitrophica bacterium CG1_02_49_10]|nr:MAG: 50S ribosomal protein L7/L12 [Candidatus Omnitrophica bacterium CG1_02_49_10]